ncbi:MAG: hypothetical protein OXT67_02270 [Zetaproteobacteria bacterium]|nr:hypothetical protein [Zetaproteobacteria bacterium]
MQKMAGYLGDNTKVETYPFTTFATIEEACAYLGLRDFNKTVTKPGDFRSSIAFDNQFRQHTIEMSFASPQKIDSKKKINLLKSKLTNNLMQWHSKWNLLINCTHLEIEPDMFEDFENMIQFFKGFFLTSLIGYGPANKGAQYPFPIFRSRHKAAAQLTSIGNIAAEEANCNSRKKQP